MNILSLFDGMSCGYLALQKAGIPIDRYDAYEIDKYALQVSKHNFPDIIQHGDVFNADFSIHKDVDILMGGSPCTYWSIAQKNNRETEASGMGWELFSQYVRALHEVKPRFFVYENNKSMSDAIRRSISETFGFDPILINSAVVSAQNRQRLYWVGRLNNNCTYTKVNIEQPKDRGILLKDILDCGSDLTSNEKGWTLTASYNGAVPWNTIERSQRNMVAEPVCVQEQVYGRKANEDGTYDRRYEARDDFKSGTVTQTNRQNSVAEPLIFNTPHGYNKGGFKSGKSPTLTANGSWQSNNFVTEPVRVGSMPRPNGELSKSQGFRVYSTDGKGVNLTAGGGGAGGKTGLYAIHSDNKTVPVYKVENGLIEIKDKQYPIKLKDGYYTIRKLTVNECKRLQTVPEWYDFSVISNTQAYKCLGNGWTVDVIAHLLSYCK